MTPCFQRLVRKLCVHCKLVDTENATYHPVGCPHCSHTGYQGRTGVFELLVTNDAIRALIHQKTSEAEIRAAALQSGMSLMRDDGQRFVQSGITSRDELVRVTRD